MAGGPKPFPLTWDWRKAFDVEFLIAEGVIDPEDRELFWYAETAREIWDDILNWYLAKGELLIPDCDS